jgi:protease IV
MNAGWYIRQTILILIFVACLGIATFITGKALLEEQVALSEPDQSFTAADGGTCDIAVIPMVGQLFASEADAEAQTATDNSDNVSAEDILQQLERVQDDDSIKGVVLQIDSPGGSPVAGDLIANALKRLSKPSVALIWDEGDSAAYLAATGANEIIASPSSNIGDIGVTSSYLDQSGRDQEDGEKFIQIAAGTYKDAGNPDNPLTPADQALLQQEVNEVYQNFIQEVSQNRSMSIAQVTALANGASLIASAATSTGLIDEIGDSETASVWFQQKLHTSSPPVLCD